MPLRNENRNMDLDDEVSKNLPHGWVWTRLGEVIEKVSLTGKKLKQSQYQEQGKIPIIDQGQNFIGGYTEREDLKITCKPVIIFGDHTKIVKYVDFDFVAGADGVKVIKPLEVFYPKLFYYFLQVVPLPEKGYARHFQFLEKSFLPLPPLAEQKRIVGKIEELFTRLEAGVEALKKVKAQIRRYRQAVLKYAFEGKLTNSSSCHPEPQSGEGISETATHHSVAPNDLPELPDGWRWVKLGDYSELITKGESPKWQGFDYVDNGIPFIRSENVLWGEINISNVARIPEEFHKKLKRSQLKPNDVLINLVGASIGRTGLVPSNIENANINQAVALIRTKDSLIPRYLMYLMLSPNLQKTIHNSKVETARPNITLEDLRQLPLPLPPLPEQQKIVSEIERRFSVVEQIEKIVDQSLKQAERLRQSILKKAFEGKLVPQNPNDESAEKLLERVRQEKQMKSDSKSLFRRRKNARQS